MKTRHFLLAALLCAGLTQCSKDAPLAAGTMKANDPEATALFQKAKSERAAGSSRSARKALEELVEMHPLAEEAPEAYLTLGDLWWEMQEPVDSFEAYDKLINMYPGSPLYGTALKRQQDLAFGAADGNVTYKLFWAFDTPVDTSKVVEMLNKVRDNAPYSKAAPQALLKVGEVFERAKAQDPAIAAYHKLIDTYANSKEAPLAQFGVGRILLSRMEDGNRNKSNLKAAQESFEDFLQKYPNHSLAPKAKENLANVRWRLASLNLDIGRFYLKSNDVPSAVYYFQEAAFDPYNAEVRGQALEELKRLGVKPQTPKRIGSSMPPATPVGR